MASVQEIGRVCVEFVAATMLTILVERFVSNRAAFLVLIVCLVLMAWFHWGELKELFPRARDHKVLAVLVALAIIGGIGWLARIWLTDPEKGFEMVYSPAIAGTAMEDQQGQRRYFDTLYAQVGVLNRGPRSIIKNWKGIAHLTDGNEVEGYAYNASEIHIYPPPPYEKTELPTSPKLLDVWTRKPIPRGERVVGCVIFKFPKGTLAGMNGPGGLFTLELWDESDRSYKLEIPWTINKPSEVFSLPGMPPNH